MNKINQASAVSMTKVEERTQLIENITAVKETNKDVFIQNIVDSEVDYQWKLERIAFLNDPLNEEQIELERQVECDNHSFAHWMDIYSISVEEVNKARQSLLLVRKEQIAFLASETADQKSLELVVVVDNLIEQDVTSLPL